ncbi:hypothetical protein P170DRAFT_415045 [Aspergillus steynii IBT 23096]|uniref:Protein ROT1 n=1 Tax=Aspergillus steynii IBT 23096 TaxID=1392250 RepID=A0A2I2FZU3_9EURO|nr:uncharacterized protein P170DRAFT_415045 [Aspergillus steynii IBT 23096]PLB46147.1 hypothetical protein P170DRAFT_415045 [Aspergillus steynii IBT 23096]
MIVGYLYLGLLATTASAAKVADLVGTWSTKSGSVVTGPGFYDAVKDKLIEPDLPGISYSFTADGHYEEAYYRALANPTNPSCPKGIMQWQHGTFTMDSDGSLELSPIERDGRQLESDPCSSSLGTYTRYNQTERFNSFKVSVDPYHNVQRLDLFSFDDSPMHPMYITYRPPQMLPTSPLESVTKDAKRKRDVGSQTESPFRMANLIKREDLVNPDRWLWLGIFMTALGGITVFCS